jgi:hypothetical protein
MTNDVIPLARLYVLTHSPVDGAPVVRVVDTGLRFEDVPEDWRLADQIADMAPEPEPVAVEWFAILTFAASTIGWIGLLWWLL